MFVRNVFSRRLSLTARNFSSSVQKQSIKGFFAANNYAIVGASTKPGSLGYIICENYKLRFGGETFYVNPRGRGKSLRFTL